MAASPLQQFLIKPLVPLHVAGIDLSFSNASLMMVLACCVALVFFAWGGLRDSLVPRGVQNVAEWVYESILTLLDETTGQKGRPFFPFVLALFLFILLGNILGMLPYSFTFTSHIITTFALAMLVFMLVTGIGIIRHGAHFLKLFLPKGTPIWMAPFIIPIELLSYLSRPVSLAIRLFANMMAGHTMLKVFAGFTVSLGFLGVAPLLVSVALTAFEILVAFLQAYVFIILTCLYLHDALYLH
ncbi:MAG: F0F1 ATP synthase subunit A [Alphaproteobacteria bacterium]